MQTRPDLMGSVLTLAFLRDLPKAPQESGHRDPVPAPKVMTKDVLGLWRGYSVRGPRRGDVYMQPRPGCTPAVWARAGCHSLGLRFHLHYEQVQPADCA